MTKRVEAAVSATLADAETPMAMTDGDSVVRLLSRRLSDSTLVAVAAGLAAVCGERPGCARLQQAAIQPATPAVPTIPSFDNSSSNIVVRGTDVHFGGWSLLFSTPIYQVSLPDSAALNDELISLLEAERRRRPSPSGGGAKSLAGNGWRTDDHFLRRPEPPVRRLVRSLTEHARHVAQYGQPRALDLHIELSGWAVVLGAGGRQLAHVHPMASWSGVYYVSAGLASKQSGGCLRLSDPRPGAQMVTLGPNDGQFMEARELCPQAGLLVLFPSWLPHGVIPLEQQLGGGGKAAGAPRIAIAFNVHAEERMPARTGDV